MIAGETRVRVFNTKIYTIGGYLLNGHEYQARPGQMVLMTADDVLYISSIYDYFATGALVAKDQYNNVIPLEEFGIYVENLTIPPSDEEITEMLKATGKRLEAWLEKLKSESRLDKNLSLDIGTIASKMDLTSSKLKILNSYEIPVEEDLEGT